jgi:hypothetical protein
MFTMPRNGTDKDTWKVTPLSPESMLVCRSADPDRVHLAAPSLLALPGGRLIAAVDQFGPGVKKLPGVKGRHPQDNHWMQGRILTSNDKGQTWDERKTFPFCHPCLFRDGQRIYLLGHRGGLQIMKSSDGGMSWSGAVGVAVPGGDASNYIQSPTSVLKKGDFVYVAMMRSTDRKQKGDPASTLAVDIWRARRGSDLTSGRSWTKSRSEEAFRDLVPESGESHVGIPFFELPDENRGVDLGGRRWVNHIGWGEPHLLEIKDPDHYLYDKNGRTLHLVAVGKTHRSNTAVLTKVVDTGAGMKVLPETVPSGKNLTYIWVPGGHMKFHILYDEESGLYWLTSNRSDDSMTRSDKLPPKRPGLPSDEYGGLQVHFSRNLVDWSFACFVAGSDDAVCSMYECSAAVRGKDLCVLCRCAGEGRRNVTDTDQIRLHTIAHFRELAY